MASIDWTKIRMRYLSSNVTYRELAKEFGVALSSIAAKAKQEDWQEERKNYRNRIRTEAEQRSIQKTAEKFSDYAADLQTEIIDVSKKLMDKIRETLVFDLPFAPKDLKSMTSAMVDLMSMYKEMTEESKDPDDDKFVVEFVNMDWDSNEQN